MPKIAKKCLVCGKTKNDIYFTPPLDVCDPCHFKNNPAMRSCLKCNSSFLSLKGNRICAVCSKSNKAKDQRAWKDKRKDKDL